MSRYFSVIWIGFSLLFARVNTTEAAFTINSWVPIYRGIDSTTAITGTNEVPLQRIAALRIDLWDPSIEFFSTPANGDRSLETDGQNTTMFVQTYGLKVGVNANFFSPVSTTPNEPRELSDLAISQGNIVSPAEGIRDLVLMTRSNQVLVTNKAPADLASYWTAVAGSDILVKNGVNVFNPSCATSFCGPNPRTAVGVSQDGHYFYMIVIDGRQAGWSDGATLLETADWLLRFGCYHGVNLDGGGSSAMAKLEGHSGVLLNRPSGGVQRVNGNHLGVFAEWLAPVILNQPQTQSALIGQPANMSIMCGGSTPLRYQWQKNGANLAGGTGTSISFPNVQPEQSGTYTVIITNSVGAITSAPAVLTASYEVSVTTGLGGIVARIPDAQRVPPATSYTLTAVPDPGFYFLNWSGHVSGTNNPITFAVSNHMSVAANFNGSVPDVIVDNPKAVLTGSWTSSTGGTNWYGTNYLTAAPVSATSTPTRTARFIPQIYTPGRYAVYEWHPVDSSRSTAVPWHLVSNSATNPAKVNQASGGGAWKLLFPGREFARGANAFVQVANNAGGTARVVADAIKLVYGFTPAMIRQPEDQIVAIGSSILLDSAVTGSEPLVYEWRFNGAKISGANSSSFLIPNAQTNNSGNYSLVVTNLYGATTSRVAAVMVKASPIIVVHPQNQSASQGTNVTFNVSALGATPFLYQWRFNDASIPSATDPTFVLTNAQASDAGSYSVLVSNLVGYEISSNAVLEVSPIAAPPYIIAQPVDATGIAGQQASFSVVANGTLPMNYQWLKNGQRIEGACQSTFRLSNVQLVDAATYTVSITNIAGAVTSAPVALVVHFSLNVSFSIGGTVNRSPSLESYPPESIVTLDAIPDTGFTFSSWVTHGFITNNPLTLVVSTNMFVAAMFEGSVSDIILDNGDADFTGEWFLGTSSGDKYGVDYHYATAVSTSATATATYTPNITTPGKYDVYIWYPQGGNRSSNAPWFVSWSDDSTFVRVNQQSNGGHWVKVVSAAKFLRGTSGFVRLSNDAGSSVVMADAVRLAFVPTVGVALQTSRESLFVGEPVQMDATTTGDTPLEYRWQRNGLEMPGNRQSTMSIPAVTLGHAGAYRCFAISPAICVASQPVILSVYNSPEEPPWLGLDPTSRAFLVRGTNYGLSLEFSRDLVSWTILTNIPPSETIPALDPDTNSIQKYYRLRWNP